MNIHIYLYIHLHIDAYVYIHIEIMFIANINICVYSYTHIYKYVHSSYLNPRPPTFPRGANLVNVSCNRCSFSASIVKILFERNLLSV